MKLVCNRPVECAGKNENPKDPKNPKDPYPPDIKCPVVLAPSTKAQVKICLNDFYYWDPVTERFLQKDYRETSSDDEEKAIPKRYITINSPDTDTLIDSIESSKKPSVPFLGFFYGLFYAFIQSASNSLSIALDYSPIFLAMARYLIMFMFAFVAASLCKQCSCSEGTWKMLLIKGLSGCITVVSTLFALSYIPLGDVNVIIYMYPVFVLLLAGVIFKEGLNGFCLFIVFLAVAAAILVMRPWSIFEDLNGSWDIVVGIGIAFCGAIFAAGNVLPMKLLQETHFSVIILVTSAMSFVLTSATAFTAHVFVVPSSSIHLGMIGLMGFLGFLADYVLITGLQTDDIPLVLSGCVFEVSIGYFLQVVYFEINPHWMSLVGSTLISISVSLIGLRKAVMDSADTSRAKKYLGFMIK